jgi:hypothetical protein
LSKALRTPFFLPRGFRNKPVTARQRSLARNDSEEAHGGIVAPQPTRRLGDVGCRT